MNEQKKEREDYKIREMETKHGAGTGGGGGVGEMHHLRHHVPDPVPRHVPHKLNDL